MSWSVHVCVLHAAHLEVEEVTTIDDVLHCLVRVLHMGCLEDYGKLGCGPGRDDLSHIKCHI